MTILDIYGNFWYTTKKYSNVCDTFIGACIFYDCGYSAELKYTQYYISSYDVLVEI